MKRTILIVEDDTYSYLLLRNFLKNLDLEILWAKTGSEAIALVRSHEEIYWVLMDISLPDINGYNATKVIRKMRPDLIIIAQTAHALYGDREKSLEAGCDDYISKPIVKKFFLSLLDKWGINNEKKLEKV